jgi:sulfur-oxidizing protein SoxZ
VARTLINVPKTAKKDEIIAIKTLISHEMETGYRPDSVGNAIPRDIITRFVCTYDGREIFSADLFPAISANPFLSFYARARASGTITFTWTGDNGFSATETADITVE